jgi:5'-3' exonuclease
MGIPYFFRWITEKYKDVFQSVADLPKVPVIDYLYLDFNEIIHAACRRKQNTKAIMTDVLGIVTRIVALVKPQRLLFIAMDGVAPRAKMNQQRVRRFHHILLQDGKKESKKERWDRNAITPGTLFMKMLSDRIHTFIGEKVNIDPIWKGLSVIFSDASVLGEGEHKIFHYLREFQKSPGYNPKSTHCIYGMDADLLLLTLLTHEEHVWMFRDDRSGKEIIHVNKLRQEILSEFQSLQISFRKDLKNMIDDFVVLCFLAGNDFLPAFHTLKIQKGAMNKLLHIYGLQMQHWDGYLTHDQQICFPKLLNIFGELALNERPKPPTSLKKKKRKRKPTLEEIQTRYYASKFSVEGKEAPAKIKKICQAYLEGLVWNLEYYCTKCPSWNWYYPYHHTPLASSILTFCKEEKFAIQFSLSAPFSPLCQLLAVLPPESSNLLPSPFHTVMTSKDSPLNGFYPSYAELFQSLSLSDDPQNKEQTRKHFLSNLPYVEEEKLQQAVKRILPELTKEEQERNEFRSDSLFHGISLLQDKS